MLGIGFPELVVIFIVALIVLGPERMPQVARQLARWVNEFRKAADELKKELAADEIGKSKDEINKVRQELLNKVYHPLPETDPEKPNPEKQIQKEKTQEKPGQKVSQKTKAS